MALPRRKPTAQPPQLTLELFQSPLSAEPTDDDNADFDTMFPKRSSKCWITCKLCDRRAQVEISNIAKVCAHCVALATHIEATLLQEVKELEDKCEASGARWLLHFNNADDATQDRFSAARQAQNTLQRDGRSLTAAQVEEMWDATIARGGPLADIMVAWREHLALSHELYWFKVEVDVKLEELRLAVRHD